MVNEKTERLVDISKLLSPISFAKRKKVSKQYIYEMMSRKKFDSMTVGGRLFIVLNEKTDNYKS